MGHDGVGRPAMIRLAVVLASLVVVVGRAGAEDARGWGWLIARLAADGLSRDEVRAVFLDDRVDAFDGMYFSLSPRESHAMYRGHLSRDSVARARRCRAAHREALEKAEARYGVDANVVAAIIHVESACGRNTGSQPILPALARLAMAREPDNLARNIARQTSGASGEEREALEARTRARAQALDDMFYRQVRATFEVAHRLGMSPLALRGSGAGAFGIPQFLPANYLTYGVDGDGDGEISLYDHDDAIYSCARYLAGEGWQPGLSRAERRRVIWSYNHSDAYIDTVLALADRLGDPDDDEPEPVQVASRRAPRHGATTRRSSRKRTAVASAKGSGRKASTGASAKRANTKSVKVASTRSASSKGAKVASTRSAGSKGAKAASANDAKAKSRSGKKKS